MASRIPIIARESEVDLWQPSHGDFRKDLALERVAEFALMVERKGLPVDLTLVDETLKIMADSYDEFQDPDPEPKLAGGHAFIGPSRMSVDNLDTMAEAYGTMPLLRSIDPEAAKVSGIPNVGLYVMRLVELIPPRILDKYTSLPGGIVYAPVTSQIEQDYIGRGEQIRKARDIVNQTASFAKRQGASVIGLGATLPRLTKYGETIREYLGGNGFEITTGHGGTAWLAGRLALDAYSRQERTYNGKQGIGILGLGAMGSVIAKFAADEIEGAKIVIYDKNQPSAKLVANDLALTYNGRIHRSDDIKDLFENSSVIVSALTEQVDLDIFKSGQLEGKIIIDDSQPAAFKREQAIKHGAALLWVVGSSRDGKFTRASDWNCGNSLMERSDLFGCEAEAAAISTVIESDRPAYAIDHAATTADIRKIGGLFMSRKIGIATPQSHGQASNL